jgi:Flp pilus assembly protein TadD
MIAGKGNMPQRKRYRALARGMLCVLSLLLSWGCATPPAQPPPTAATPAVQPRAGEQSKGPAAAPAPPASSAGAPTVMRPREQQPSAAMVASAQWVEEASRAIDVGDYDRATSLLERAVSVEPNNGRAYYYYGLAMGERGRPGAALSLFQKAEILLQGDPRALGETYAQMGTNLERLGRRTDAVRRYEQALGQDPSNALARRRIQALRG